MAKRDSHKNQTKKMKKASNAINQEKDFGNDIGEAKHNELRGGN
ncbi:hypothetical protein [Bacillus sp. AK128]